MYAVVDLKTKFVHLYKDKSKIADHIGCHYSTITRNLDKKGYYERENYLVCETKSYKSNRGNPFLG